MNMWEGAGESCGCDFLNTPLSDITSREVLRARVESLETPIRSKRSETQRSKKPKRKSHENGKRPR